MKLEEALKTYKKITRREGTWIQLCKPYTGKYANLVGCPYFLIDEGDGLEAYFSTSLDLYPEDILAEDWEVV